MAAFVWKMQNEIVNGLEGVEGPQGGKFFRDSWTRKEGGKGMSCVLQDGKVFEKAGVNVSVIESPAPEGMLNQMRARKVTGLGAGPYNMFVAGISLVLHPHNPMAPTVHLNYRYFELIDPKNPSKPVAWWFGGGSDLVCFFLWLCKPEQIAHQFLVIDPGVSL
jgi:coproporphyrinogen III oxidase